MAYRPQANGTAERMVQTATKTLTMYVRDLNRKDWDKYVECLTFAINTTQDRVRGETLHYLVHRDQHWRPQFPSNASDGTIGTRNGGVTGSNGLINRHGNYRFREIISDRASRHNEDVGSHQSEAESWVYWVPDLGADEYEVQHTSDVRSGKKTPFGRIYRVWVRYDEPTWADDTDLNCGTIQNGFLRERVNHNRYSVMQSHEEV
ncbi:LOW QUALITY PROTEIN: reverse transcriptase [Phytophthora megakarya]|uniref:Reverse transcriptase n=1 Tax=Phytophthora megakarya TaxID=4795 RepID=A0A225W0V4_9STRA|nr:LOW QUALITY PROTEIN: reverse transcriptase [Phytophthora megakarya]